ncbi:MAG TPA: HAD-IIIA family hydrolase [Steroidobacteraceae bacterium]|nr:HAD-IIIA family hydrolase [Steroidobacteraceae bacterium]
MATKAPRVRHVILDRDGVLNVEAPNRGYITRPESWQWLPGAREALALLTRAGIRVSVATNQSGVGRGLMSAADLEAVHARMRREALAAGGRIDALYACPHAPEAGCPCRKPAPGLIEEAIAAAQVPACETLVVGDDGRDLQAADAAGVPAALVLTGKGRAAAALSPRTVPVYDDLLALARALVGPGSGEGIGPS